MSEIELAKLQQIERRLREIWHKHVRVIVSDSQDVIEVKQRLEGILNTLSDWSDLPPSATEIRAIARDLGTTHRQLSILGFVNIGRVIASVEESLVDVCAEPKSDEDIAPPQRFVPPVQTNNGQINETFIQESRPRNQTSNRSPLLFLFHIVCGAIIGWAAGLWIIDTAQLGPASLKFFVGAGIFPGLAVALVHRKRPDTTKHAFTRLLIMTFWFLACVTSIAAVVLNRAQGPVEVTEIIPPTPTSAAPEIEATPTIRVDYAYETSMEDLSIKVTNEIRLAEEALARSDLKTAIEHFGKAVATDRYHRLIKETAEKLIKVMLDDAELAAEKGRWENASELVEDALNLANHFHLDDGTIKHTRTRHNSMARFVDTAPKNIKALRAATGKRVKVLFHNAEIIRGAIQEVNPPNVTLEVLSGVGGGQVTFTKTYPLSEIHNFRIYGEGVIDPPKETPTPTAIPRPTRRYPRRPRRG